MKRLSPSTFFREANQAACLGASTRDRALLWSCQVLSSIRYRFPRAVSNLRLEPSIRCNGRVLRTPIRFAADDWLAFQQVFVDGEYDWPGSEPLWVMDAGANCGYASLWLNARFPNAKICSIEPHPVLARSIRETLKRNEVPATVIQAALSSIDGTAQLHFGSLSTTHSLHTGRPLGGSGSVEVETISMPTLLERLEWPRIDLLKLDIEGAEVELLAGTPSWLSRVRAIVGELHGAYGPEQLAADLEPAGFRVTARKTTGPYLFTACR